MTLSADPKGLKSAIQEYRQLLWKYRKTCTSQEFAPALLSTVMSVVYPNMHPSPQTGWLDDLHDPIHRILNLVNTHDAERIVLTIAIKWAYPGLTSIQAIPVATK